MSSCTDPRSARTFWFPHLLLVWQNVRWRLWLPGELARRQAGRRSPLSAPFFGGPGYDATNGLGATDGRRDPPAPARAAAASALPSSLEVRRGEDQPLYEGEDGDDAYAQATR